MLRFSGGLVLIQHNGLFRAAAGAVQPHVGLAGGGAPRLFQHLQRCLIRVQYRLPAKLLMQHIVDRPQPFLRSLQQPVGHSLPGQLQALTVELLFQPVQRRVHDEFLCCQIRHCLRRGKAAWQQRRLFRCLYNVGLAGPLLTVLAGVGVVYVLADPELRRLHLQRPANLFANLH